MLFIQARRVKFPHAPTRTQRALFVLTEWNGKAKEREQNGKPIMPNSTYPILSDGRFGRRLTRTENNDEAKRTSDSTRPFGLPQHSVKPKTCQVHGHAKSTKCPRTIYRIRFGCVKPPAAETEKIDYQR